MSDQIQFTPHNLQSNDEIGKYFVQILLEIIREHPEYLIEQHRERNWQDKNVQEKLIQYFSGKFQENKEKTEFINIVINLFRLFLIPFSLSDEKIINLLINNYYINTNYYNTGQKQKKLSLEFSILLIDIENIFLDTIEEDFIKKSCKYPLKHSLAFGNWKKLGTKDEDLHERGYELFHVPQGKNNADSRMTNIGSFICLNYPSLKEIFVCSSDHDLNILCDFLSTKDIDVYQVFRKINCLCIKNLKTKEILSYPIIFNSKFSKVETLIQELKQILYQEIISSMKANKQQLLFPMSKISALFDQKNGLSLNQVVAHHFPGQKAKYIFSEYKNDFVIHNSPDSKETFVTLFDISSVSIESSNDSKNNELPQLIYSKESIEEIIIIIVKQEMKKNNNKKIESEIITTKFYTNYKVPITTVLKEAKLPKKFFSFIQTSNKLEHIIENNKNFIALSSNQSSS